MSDQHVTESDVSEAGADAPAATHVPNIEDTVDPTADSEIAGDSEGREPGFTFPGPGA